MEFTCYNICFYQILISVLGHRKALNDWNNTKDPSNRSANHAPALHGQLTLTELLEESSKQTTRIQDEIELAQVCNKDDHCSNEHKTPESEAIETNDIDDAIKDEDETHKSNASGKESEPASSLTNVAGNKKYQIDGCSYLQIH